MRALFGSLSQILNTSQDMSTISQVLDQGNDAGGKDIDNVGTIEASVLDAERIQNRAINQIAVTYGSGTDQSAQLLDAVSNASDNDVINLGTGVIKCEVNIPWSKILHFEGNRGARIQTVSNISIFTPTGAGANGSSIRNIKFIGNSAGAAQYGIFNSGVFGLKVQDCVFENLAVAGYHTQGTSNVSPYPMNLIQSCDASGCGSGFSLGSTGEYHNLALCNARQCTNGFRILAGNFQMTTCFGNANAVGILFDAGTNGGHGSIIGGEFNHNTSLSLNINALTDPNGLEIIGAQLFAAPMTINASRVRFFACEISASGITFSNSNGYSNYNVKLAHCEVFGSPTLTYQNGLTSANVGWHECFDNNGNAFTG